MTPGRQEEKKKRRIIASSFQYTVRVVGGSASLSLFKQMHTYLQLNCSHRETGSVTGINMRDREIDT